MKEMKEAVHSSLTSNDVGAIGLLPRPTAITSSDSDNPSEYAIIYSIQIDFHINSIRTTQYPMLVFAISSIIQGC